MSSTNLSMSENALNARLREKLNVENVKLWTEPFYDPVTKTVVDSEILALASRYAAELKFEESVTIETLFLLQANALERIAERDWFKTTGLSTLRIRYSGFSTDHPKHGNIERIQVDLSTLTGSGLRARIAEILAMEENRLKLICLGRVLKDSLILDAQHVKNGSQIMVLCVAGGGSNQDALHQDEDQFRQLEETRVAADYLAGREQNGMYSLQVADQHGKPLDLPPEDKKALAVALALHEKGRAALKTQDFSRGLVFLLESDTVYSQCQSGILDMVDNYGMLNLDIAWGYLMLQSISELPAVEMRLGKCERALHRSYGENMERVVALKGSTGWEAALFVRLHLLQGIAAYHLGHLEKSRFLIRKVETEIERLRVSDEQLADFINMGYNEDEARMGLRAAYGNMDGAVDYIMRKREEQAALRKQENENRRRQKLQKRLGLTEQGQPVNVSFLQNMVEMGYHAVLASQALKRTNNDINAALQLVTDPIFISSVISELKDSPSSGTSTSTSSNPTTSTEASASQPNAGNTTNPAEPQLPPISRSFEALMNEAQAMDDSEGVSPEEMERSQKAYESLSKDIGTESDYIDLTLSAEMQFLDQYKALLQG